MDWRARNYDRRKWDAADVPNRCLSAATSCLYGITEAAVLAAGYAPAVGFIHTGKPLSFVYDIADLFKFDTVVPVAFRIAAKAPSQPERDVRLACRDIFRSSKLLTRIIPTIEEVLAAGGVEPPSAPPESVPSAIPNPEGIGDLGHRTQG
ncbi:CRISPR-associated endonuclease Cas1 [Pseudomonas aeruginosa]|uniref:CRISPR-associated endonuclease Cas1 n=2 Tax=Pseudomonas aeruginosa TaxID=287 RepID=UPI001F0891E8|nr:CRISPR-associated endonuclease Cas1 [Pseudomonas aeruginosa]